MLNFDALRGGGEAAASPLMMFLQTAVGGVENSAPAVGGGLGTNRRKAAVNCLWKENGGDFF